MACNCKSLQKYKEENGEMPNESLSTKAVRYLFKLVYAVLAVVITMVVTPIVIAVALYKVLFAKEKKIILPRFLGKYMAAANG